VRVPVDFEELLVSVPEEPETERFISPAERRIYINISAHSGANMDRFVEWVTPPHSSAV